MYYDIALENEDTLEVKSGIDLNASSVAGILNLSDKVIDFDTKLYSQCVKHYNIDTEIYEDLCYMSEPMRNNIALGLEILPVFDKLYKDIFFSLYKYKPEIRKGSKMKASTKINHTLMTEIVNTDEFKEFRKTCCMDLFNSILGTELIGKKAIEIINSWKKEDKQNNELVKTINIMLEEEEKQEALEEELCEIMNVTYNNSETEDNKEEENIDEDNEDIEDEDDEEDENENEDMDNNDDDFDDGEDIDNVANNSSSSSNNSNNDDDSDEDSDIDEKAVASMKMSLEESKKIANELAEKLDKQLEETSLDDLADNIVDTFKDITKEVIETKDYLENWGFDESNSQGQRIPFDAKRKALETIRKSHKLEKMSKLIGRLKQTALEDQKKKSKDGAVIIKSITTGNDIKNVLPSEKMQLLNDTLKYNFYKKYNQKELLQYEVESHTVKSKGPMIVCIDTSGSMQGEQEIWSKAVAIALLEIATVQKRSYAAIHFSDKVYQPIIIEKNKVLDPQKVLKIAEFFDDGSTDFEKPLNKALEIIKNSAFKHADIVFITDGEADVSDKFLSEFNKVKKAKEFNVLSICINIGRGSSSTSTLKQFSDDVINVSEFADLTNETSNVVHSIFNKV